MWLAAGVSSRVRETNVIDNKKVFLRDELVKKLPYTKNASIAVGYFFISGLAVIIEPLQKVDKVRLLISNTTNKETSEALIEGFQTLKQTHSAIKKRNHLTPTRKHAIMADSKENIAQSLEYMNQTNNDKYTVQTLISMMRKKQIEVRVYPKEKLHAKAYVFEYRDTDLAEGMGIVGSSNLSLSGIYENSELNLKTLHGPDINKLLDWFDALWSDGLDFTQEFNEILKRSWAGHVYSPYELYLKAIYHEYKNRVDPEHKFDPIWEADSPALFHFQRQAVDQCITMIELYGGAIIGDVVGLGKTYVGTVLLKYFQLQKCRPLIICPPTLVEMWKKFCKEYKIYALVLSRGKLTRESYDLVDDYMYQDRDLVLIDESHHFKNNNSRQYENLWRFMYARRARAILLTATPYSNNATDIKNQIMLFHTSPKTSIPPANYTDLDEFFKRIHDGDANLVELLQNIMVRRTRRYVLKHWGKKDSNDPNRRYLQIGSTKKYFPGRKMQTSTYDINQSYDGKYDAIVGLLVQKSLKLARYSPGLYLKRLYQNVEPYSDLKTTGPKLVQLVRSSLLKRMESSVQAFRASIGKYIATHKLFLKSLDTFIPVGDLESAELYEAADPESDFDDEPDKLQKLIDQIKQKGKNRYKLDAFEIDRLKSDVQQDLETFENIMEMLKPITHDTDNKLHMLQNLLNTNIKNNVIVFTEFASTAEYLYTNIKWPKRQNMELVTSKHNNILQAARRFDPDNNPSPDRSPIVPEKRLTLLITTDVLSEGVNLQAGNVVINYDFHWNPVRLIQRVGRVDRIGSKHEYIHVYNFLPDPKIEQHLRLEEIVRSKINEIHKVIGEDHSVLVQTEKLNENDMYVIYKNDISILDREDGNPLEPTEFEQLLTNIRINNTVLWDELRKIPNGVRSSKNPRSGKLLLACSVGSAHAGTITKYYTIDHKKNIKAIDSRTALSLLKSTDKSTPTLPDDYDIMLSAGWKQFLNDQNQHKADAKTRIKLSASQKAILKRLYEIACSAKPPQNHKMIDPLRAAFSISLIKGKLSKELNRIRKTHLTDEQFIEALGELYRNFNLRKKTERRHKESDIPRIIYSAYVGE